MRILQSGIWAARTPACVTIARLLERRSTRLGGRTLPRADEPDALARDSFHASFPEDRSAGEPDSLSPMDFLQDRLSRLVRKAIEQEKNSRGRGAIDLPRRREQREVGKILNSVLPIKSEYLSKIIPLGERHLR